MYTAKNKKESRELIKRLDLNTIPEVFLNHTDYKGMESFVNNEKVELYVVRDAEHSSSKYYYAHNYDEVVAASKNYSGQIILAVSINAYKNKVLLGAIEINRNNITICATTDPAKDHRTMYDNPEFDYKTDIFDKKLSKIPEIDFLYKYVLDNELQGLTIEFTIYDRLVGNKKEKILINELRNY